MAFWCERFCYEVTGEERTGDGMLPPGTVAARPARDEQEARERFCVPCAWLTGEAGDRGCWLARVEAKRNGTGEVSAPPVPQLVPSEGEARTHSVGGERRHPSRPHRGSVQNLDASTVSLGKKATMSSGNCWGTRIRT